MKKHEANFILAVLIYNFLNDEDIRALPSWTRRYKDNLHLLMKSWSMPSKELMDKLEENPLYQKAMRKEVSLLVVGLELTRHWVQNCDFHPQFVVSKKKLRLGFRNFAMDMLMLKIQDKSTYKEKSDILDESIEVALMIYGAINQELLGGEYPAKDTRGRK